MKYNNFYTLLVKKYLLLGYQQMLKIFDKIQ